MTSKVWLVVAALAAVASCRTADLPSGTVSSRADAHAAAERLLRTNGIAAHLIPVFVDGRRVARQDPSAEFNIVDPRRIASIQMLTGAAAEDKAGSEGRQGVIWVTTTTPAR